MEAQAYGSGKPSESIGSIGHPLLLMIPLLGDTSQ